MHAIAGTNDDPGVLGVRVRGETREVQGRHGAVHLGQARNHVVAVDAPGGKVEYEILGVRYE